MAICTCCGAPTPHHYQMGGTGKAPADLVDNPHYTVVQTPGGGYTAGWHNNLCLACMAELYGVNFVYQPGTDSNSSGLFCPR